MTDPTTISGVDLARQFYSDHELDFQRAIQVEETAERGFDFTDARFDDWAVQNGYMSGVARDAVSAVERDGLTQQRFRLRGRLNRAARKGIGLHRAFSIEASGGKWRVDLSERFLVQRPTRIIRGLRSTMQNAEQQIEQTGKLIKEQEYLTDEDRTVLMANLSMARMFIFNNMQNIEMIAMMASSGKAPDLRKLLRRFTSSITSEMNPPKPKKARRRRA
jgi:hypothetical protein